MDSSMISKIEKAMRYAQEPDRISFEQFRVSFNGDHKSHVITYREGQWTCDCEFFNTRGVCSHVMTLERVFMGMVQPAQVMPVPA
jgi:SWIM zinc finger